MAVRRPAAQWENSRPMHLLALSAAAADLLQTLLAHAQPADMAVSQFFEKRRTGSRERARLADAAYAVLRRKRWYEHLARRFEAEAPAGFANSADWPMPRRMALLALLDGEGSESSDFSDAPAELRPWLAACRALQSQPASLPEACRHNLPDWLAAALQASMTQQPQDFWPLAEALLQAAPLDLRVNAMKAKRPAVAAALAASGIQTQETPWSPWGLRVAGKPRLAHLPAWQQGLVEVQDEGSQLLALLTQARRGQLVVDFCAGAGGKTLALGAMMRGAGRLYAFDASAHRLQGLQPRLARSGLGNVHTAAIAHERDARLNALQGKADAVLVDAPCSGLGTLRRAPGLKWRTRPEDIARLAGQQFSIAQSAARLVKPGGRLVYATCSLLPQENEAVAQALSNALPGFAPLHAGDVLAAAKVPQAARLTTEAGHLRLWPHLHGTDGFFAAVWLRR